MPKFEDVRLHDALNGLSIGCPNLLPEAFVATHLDRQLDGAAKAFVNHPRGIEIESDADGRHRKAEARCCQHRVSG